MTAAELVVFEKLQSEGFAVVNRGWPDFLAFRIVNGIPELRAVEVKGPTDRMSEYQRNMHDLLAQAGIKVQVVNVVRSQVEEVKSRPNRIVLGKWVKKRGKKPRNVRIHSCSHEKKPFARLCQKCWDLRQTKSTV
jgi:hypothetical protein